MRLPRIISTRTDGVVEIHSISPELIVSFMRWGEARPHVWYGDVQPSPNDVMTQTAAEAAAVGRIAERVTATGGLNIRVDVGEDVTDFAGLHAIKWSDGSVTGRRFRDCCRRVGNGFPRIDMPLARAMRMTEVRFERNKRLTKSDGEILKARDQADVPREAALKTYRQSLRDGPLTWQVAVDGCASPEVLHTWQPVWPQEP